jgi:thymidylate synthase
MTTRHEEHQYLDLIHRILATGSREEGRNGTTLSVFGNMMRFSLQDGVLPLLTTKRVAWKTCFHELFWFIRGSTDNTELKSQNVHIWDANGSREFLDSRGLTHLQEDDLGPVYGHQWRHFNAEYTDCKTDYAGKGKDQLAYIINALNDPVQRTSRRLVMSAWNPCQIDDMALPPCHVLCQFNVHDGNKLSCSLYQRSGDVGLGVPFNIASYSLLTHLIAKHCGLEAHEFVYFLGNAHIYENHIEPLKQQIIREPMEFPRIEIAEKLDNIESYNLASVLWKTNYVYHTPIKMDMVA